MKMLSVSVLEMGISVSPTEVNFIRVYSHINAGVLPTIIARDPLNKNLDLTLTIN